MLLLIFQEAIQVGQLCSWIPLQHAKRAFTFIAPGLPLKDSHNFKLGSLSACMLRGARAGAVRWMDA
jgi:hypothetical protein